ncbi:glycosyl transferase family 39 [endosymbiont of Tevnia jerichonana (vent Tica)]|jgi:4-amino-4-deoxy-L-arabinose transferase-like glycosyltransferase|uniref:Glycosyl transferase family 39 n=1 Tax=endosymbiont of Tevnia jerichonana (vent Tica) TaxID=1049564 RepID=G2FBJ7_9GAMM|nr:glycosyltransferase family 39 protein [Candidatus Endoriftia persephone]EGW55678.1 glycosyl transferase family 39 [endosymbiont of Tevnia jerichonana (vent Tica)]
MTQDFSADRDARLLLLWLLTLLVGFFLNLHAVPLFDLDEGAFSEATREMFERGDFLSTYLNGVPRYDKPILIYWLQAASVSLFGLNEFAFRLPSALAASLWSLALVLFGRRYFGQGAGLAAGILLAGSIGVTLIGKAATADALLNLCLTLSMLNLYRFFESEQHRYLRLAALAAGLGFLAKGPVSLLIPGAVALLFSLSSGRLRQLGAMLIDWRAWGLFLLVAAPWYLVQYLQNGMGFFEGFFFTHNSGRFSDAMEGHQGGFWFYLPVLLLATLPFTLPIAGGLGMAVKRWSEPLPRFLLIWFGFVFLFFSFSATKLPHYLIYGLTPLFLLGGVWLSGKRLGTAAFLPLLLLLGLLLALPGLLDMALPQIKDPYAQAALAEPERHFTSAYYGGIGLALVAAIGLMLFRRRLGELSLLATGLLAVFALSGVFLPVFGQIQQGPVKRAAELARGLPGEVIMWRAKLPSFSVYREAVTPTREPRAGDLVLTKRHHRADLPPHTLLFDEGGIVLVKIDPEIPHESTQAAPPTGLDAASTERRRGAASVAGPAQSRTVAAAEPAGTGRPGALDLDHHPRGWPSGAGVAAAATAAQPTPGLGRDPGGADRRTAGASAEADAGRTAATGVAVSVGAADNRSCVPQPLLSVGSQCDHLRPGRRAEPGVVKAPATGGCTDCPGDSGGAVTQRGWGALAGGYPGWRQSGMDRRYPGYSPRRALALGRTGAWSQSAYRFPAAVRPCTAADRPYWLPYGARLPAGDCLDLPARRVVDRGARRAAR